LLTEHPPFKLIASGNKELGQLTNIETQTDAETLKAELQYWSANQRAIIVEHLLLRPKFIGDALDLTYSDSNCTLCADEDAYSFRLSYVMPSWIPPYNTNMEMRNFADRTIRQETPAHLICKICWVANDSKEFDDFAAAWCDWLKSNAEIDWTQERLQERVQAILASKLTKDSVVKLKKNELCLCAATIVTEFGSHFYTWMNNKFKPKSVLKDFDFKTFVIPQVTLCKDLEFEADTATTIQNLLKTHYKNYVEVSYRLKRVLTLLSTLHSSYPPATLHDCDDANDQNPVRLGSTALGTSH
jgi:hypothetical protein